MNYLGNCIYYLPVEGTALQLVPIKITVVRKIMLLKSIDVLLLEINIMTLYFPGHTLVRTTIIVLLKIIV